MPLYEGGKRMDPLDSSYYAHFSYSTIWVTVQVRCTFCTSPTRTTRYLPTERIDEASDRPVGQPSSPVFISPLSKCTRLRAEGPCL